jgi:predicted ATP-grasp superfamily ATP-dependent carboligase
VTSFDTDVPALTLKVGDYPLHHGGLAVVRTLGRVGVPVYGVHEDRLAPAGLSRYATGRFVWPTGGQHTYQQQLLDGIASVGERIGRPAVLIPTDDHAALFVAEQAHVLRQWFLIPDQCATLVRDVIDKATLYERCRAIGAPVPNTVVAGTDGDLRRLAADMSFPIVVKRGAPWLHGDGRRATSTRLVDRPSDLMAGEAPTPVLLQEHIPAGEGDDWLFHGYCDSSSRCLLAGTGRKVRSFPPRAGETSLGRSEPNPDLDELARSLLTAIGYRGVVSMDYRFDRRDGTYKLLDLNPRPGAIFRLFVTRSGEDVIRALHLDMTGRAVPAEPVMAGRTVVVEGSYLRGGSWDWRAWRSAHELAWLAADDPVPALVALLRSTGRAGRRLARRPARRLVPRRQPSFIAGRS